MAKKPADDVVAVVSDSLINNPAIYPTETPDGAIGQEVTPGISVDTSAVASQPKVEEAVKPVNVMDVPQVDTISKEPDISMDDLVKQAIEKSEEPTAFDRQEEEKNLAIDATKLVSELENYIRLVVKDEINNNK